MRANYKVPHGVEKRMTRELYQYWKNIEELQEIDKDIIESSPIRDETGIKSKYQISKPTESKALRIAEAMSTRAYLMARRRIGYVKEAMKRLNDNDIEVIEYIFRDGYSQIRAEIDKNISKDVYYNARSKIIYYTALEFGEI